MKLKRQGPCLAAVFGVVVGMTAVSRGMTITEAEALPNGSAVTIDNLLISSTTDLVNSPSSKNFMGQDATGGVTIYGTNANIDAVLVGTGPDGRDLVPGDRVNLSGTTGQYNGLFQLTAPFTVTYVDSPGVPAPAAVTLSDFQDGSPTAEGLESKLVKLSNVTFTTSGDFAYGNYSVNADGDPLTEPKATVRVSTAQLDLVYPVSQPIPTSPVNITGIFYQFTSYQLLVREYADIEPLAPSASSATSITVKNAPQYTITLQGLAIEGGALTYKIKQTADRMFPAVDHNTQGGTLYLPGTTTPVTIDAAVPGNQVDFEPAEGASGWYQFVFTVSQEGYAESDGAAVDIFIQDPDKVVITEIMYQPMGYQYDWEYVEVRNVGGTDITLDTLFDSNLRNSENIENNLRDADDYGTAPVVDASIIPAGQTRVIAEITAYRDTAQLLNAWNPGAGDVAYPVQGGDLNKIQRQHLIMVNYAAGTAALPGLNNDGDTLILLDADGHCLDVVKYENGTNGWPAANDSGSIFLESNKMTVTDNDDGANWRLSATGVTDGIAYISEEIYGPPREANVGSPALIPTVTTLAIETPMADYQILDTVINQGASSFTQITLSGSDPQSRPLTYKVLELVEGFAPTTGGGGQLKDANNLNDVAPGMTLPGDGLLFKPDPAMTGRYALKFVVNNGLADSPIEYVTLFVQSDSSQQAVPDQPRVVITEIMFNPYNQSDIEWEWIEVKNLTSSPVALHSLLDDNYKDYTVVSTNSKPGNLDGITVPANGTKVIARQIDAPVSPWLTEWYKPSAAGATVFVPDARWPALNNGTASGKSFADRVFLLAADGSLLDVVAYDDGDPWPVDPNNPAVYFGHSSIYFTGSTLDTLDNDAGASWAFSVDGYANAYATTNGLDFGSPGILPSDKSLIFDFNGDGDVDVAGLDNDFDVLDACSRGAAVPHDGTAACRQADYNGDGDVDVADFGKFQMCLQSAGMTAPADCLR